MVERKSAESSWKAQEICGSSVFEESGNLLGVLVDILPTAANDVFVVKSASLDFPEILIPVIKSVVIDVDIANKKIRVSLPEGLLEVYRVSKSVKDRQ